MPVESAVESAAAGRVFQLLDMALPFPFRSKENAVGSSRFSENVPPADELRARARRRLIGAVILLGIGILAFPLLFETAPRPIPVDLPIEVPRRDAVAPLQVPTAPSAPSVAKSEAKVEPKADAVGPGKTMPAPPPPPVASTAQVAPAPASVPSEPAARSRADDGARARALLEGKTRTAAGGEHWIVQIGAFAEDKTVRDVRARAGKLGIKTYTQAVAVESGTRTRVRVGPFDDRAAADSAAAKLKKAGLPASVQKP